MNKKQKQMYQIWFDLLITNRWLHDQSHTLEKLDNNQVSPMSEIISVYMHFY